MTAVPFAHVGHYLWILYVIPFLVVVISIARSVREQRRERGENHAKDG